MRTRPFLLAALVAALLLVAAVPARAAGPETPRTWGNNSFGELGDGSTANRFAAGPVAGLADATELGGGREHVVALRADGSVWTWGSNQYGQQGNGGTANRRARARWPAWPGRSRWPAATTTAWLCSATARSAPGA